MALNDTFASHSAPAVLVGGGHISAEDFVDIKGRTGSIIAVDGGANRLLAGDIMPDLLVGDLDSVTQHTLSQIPSEKVLLTPDQNLTDFDKALVHVQSALILAFGFLGHRVDHQLAVLSGLAKQPNKAVILIGEDDIIFLAQPRMTFDLPKGTRFSLFPLDRVQGASKGLKWPIEGIEFTPAGRIGTSNETVGRVELSIDQPAMLVLFPRAFLDQAIRSLMAADAHWPALGTAHKDPR